jgi:hypothetical protein
MSVETIIYCMGLHGTAWDCMGLFTPIPFWKVVSELPCWKKVLKKCTKNERISRPLSENALPPEALQLYGVEFGCTIKCT